MSPSLFPMKEEMEFKLGIYESVMNFYSTPLGDQIFRLNAAGLYASVKSLTSPLNVEKVLDIAEISACTPVLLQSAFEVNGGRIPSLHSYSPNFGEVSKKVKGMFNGMGEHPNWEIVDEIGGGYDLVVSFHGIERRADWKYLLDTIPNVLNDGGMLFLSLYIDKIVEGESIVESDAIVVGGAYPFDVLHKRELRWWCKEFEDRGLTPLGGGFLESGGYNLGMPVFIKYPKGEK